MITIDQVLTDVLRREGWPKVTDRPSDLGNLTKGGVTFANYNRWRVANGERALTRDEFVHITEQDARTFFEDEFCRPFRFVSDEGIFVLLSDWAINAGPDDPTVALQTCLKARDLYRGKLDGIPGPATRAAWLMVSKDLQACAEIELELIKLRRRFHTDTVLKRDPEVVAFLKAHPTSQLHNLEGWLRRTEEFLA